MRKQKQKFVEIVADNMMCSFRVGGISYVQIYYDEKPACYYVNVDGLHFEFKDASLARKAYEKAKECLE